VDKKQRCGNGGAQQGDAARHSEARVSKLDNLEGHRLGETKAARKELQFFANKPGEKAKAAHRSEDKDKLATVPRFDAMFLPKDELQQICQARIASAEEIQRLDCDVNKDHDGEELEAG
jgi:hypothetical protein